jgi:hypothetical protein
MSEQLIDLTKIRPKDAVPWTFDQRDMILFLATGAVGYLLKEALKHCFPGTPNVTEQLEVLSGRDLRAIGCRVTEGEDFDRCQICMANAEMC